MFVLKGDSVFHSKITKYTSVFGELKFQIQKTQNCDGNRLNPGDNILMMCFVLTTEIFSYLRKDKWSLQVAKKIRPTEARRASAYCKEKRQRRTDEIREGKKEAKVRKLQELRAGAK